LRCRTTNSALEAGLALVLAAGCSSGGLTAPATPEYDSGRPTMSAPPEAGEPVCTAASVCAPPGGGPPPAAWQCVKTVDATVLDSGHNPVTGFAATTCGKNLCTSAVSDGSGRLHFAVCEYMNMPAFKVEGGSKYISFATLLSAEDAVVPPAVLARFPANGVALVSGMDASSGGVTLALPAGTAITIDPFLSTDEQMFRAVTVPLADAPPSVDPTLGLEMLFGMAPLNARLVPSARLTFANTAHWPARAEVELFLHGVDLAAGALAPYGGWAAIGTGHVSDDALTVSTDPGDGNGVGELSLVGVRLRR
jgi:hypothetical protein